MFCMPIDSTLRSDYNDELASVEVGGGGNMTLVY